MDTPGDTASHTYTVRANNGCGMNAVTTGASAADLADAAAPAMTTMNLAKATPNLNFSWSSAEAGATYNTYKSASSTPPSWGASANTTGTLSWSDATDLGTGTSVFFTTTAKDGCNNESAK